MVHTPLFPLQQGRNPSIAVTTILGRQFHHPPNQPRLVARSLRLPPLSRARLTQHLTSPTLRQSFTSYRSADVLDCLTPTRRAQKFPEAASLRISMSKA